MASDNVENFEVDDLLLVSSGLGHGDADPLLGDLKDENIEAGSFVNGDQSIQNELKNNQTEPLLSCLVKRHSDADTFVNGDLSIENHESESKKNQTEPLQSCLVRRPSEADGFVNGDQTIQNESKNNPPEQLQSCLLRRPSEESPNTEGNADNDKKEEEKSGDQAGDEEDVADLSKSVTFAEDVAVYNLQTVWPQIPVPHVPDVPTTSLPDDPSSPVYNTGGVAPDHWTNSIPPPAVLQLDSAAVPIAVGFPASAVEPIIVPLRSEEDDDEVEKEKVEVSPKDNTEDGSDTPKHMFQVTKVSESPDGDVAEEHGREIYAELEKDIESKIGKVDSYLSDSGHSTLSYNQDTIGPLENQSFLKHLNYSVSQAAMNEAGTEDDDIDLVDFSGVKADVDEGWAWVILFAASCSLMITGATLFAAGVFMPYVLAEIESDIAIASWIGAVHASSVCFSGPLVSSVFAKIGARNTAFLAGLAQVVGLSAAYFAQSFLHLLLTYGLLTGIGCGFTLNIMFVITGQYFNRYRGFACGMLATGAGAGILSVGSIINYLLDNYGLNGAYLMWAGFSSHTLVFAMLLRPSNEELLRQHEEKMSKEQIKMGINNSNSLPSGINSMGSGLMSVYSNGDLQSAFSGRTSNSGGRNTKLRRHASKRSCSSRGESSVNPLLRLALNQDVCNSNYSVSNRSHRSAALSSSSLAQNVKLLDSTLRASDGQSLTVPGFGDGINPSHLTLPGSGRPSTHNISPLALPEKESSSSDQQSSPTDKSSPSTLSPSISSPTQATSHIHSSFSLANETIPEHEVLTKPGTFLEPPPSPTFSRSAPSEFRRRLLSSTSQQLSRQTSYSHISRGTSLRGPMRNGDLDNESLTSTMVAHLSPKDILEPRYRLGSRSIPALFGSIASFPTSLAILKDDLSRIDAVGEPIEKTLQDHMNSLMDSLRLLRNYPFLVFMVTCMMWTLGESPYTLYLPAYAISQGTSPADASSVYTAMGFGSMCGRFLSGLVASDSMIGPLLIHIGCLGLAGLVIIFTPILALDFATQMLMSGMYGLYTGSLVSLLSLITIELLGITELGLGFGFLCMAQGMAYLVGPPVGGIFVQLVGFKVSFFIFGIIMVAGSLLAMMIAVIIGREVGGEDDDNGSLDDLERALRRVSNCMSSDDSEDEGEGSVVGSAPVSEAGRAASSAPGSTRSKKSDRSEAKSNRSEAKSNRSDARSHRSEGKVKGESCCKDDIEIIVVPDDRLAANSANAREDHHVEDESPSWGDVVGYDEQAELETIKEEA